MTSLTKWVLEGITLDGRAVGLLLKGVEHRYAFIPNACRQIDGADQAPGSLVMSAKGPEAVSPLLSRREQKRTSYICPLENGQREGVSARELVVRL